MNNRINIRNSIIVILCVTIIFMSIGFIIISVNYTKNKNKNISYNVVFNNIKKISSVKGSNIEPKGIVKISDDSTEIEMSITMNSVHDELAYVTTIENKGTVPIKILDIMESPDYKLDSFKKLINPITVTLSDIKGKVLEPKETVDLKIVFYYNTGKSEPKNFDYKIGIITRSK
ncbi:MAG: hypothetical protein IK137_03105 [Bacilli bacterium]|nr:hypothetical protein [Bacilli bacterium]